MDVPGISRPVLVVLIVAAVLLFAFGATKAVGLLTEHTDTHTRTLAAAPTIVVHTGTGDVRIVASDRTDVRLTTKEKRSVWGGGHVRVCGDAAELRLETAATAPGRRRPVRRGLVLEVPRGTSVRVVTGTGDLHAENLRAAPTSGPAPATCTSSACAGRCALQPTPATCTSRRPSPDVVRATGTGDIDIVASQPRSIQPRPTPATSTSVVPDLTYAVDAQTDTGDDNVGVRRDDASPRKLRAHTDTGDVHLEPDG